MAESRVSSCVEYLEQLQSFPRRVRRVDVDRDTKRSKVIETESTRALEERSKSCARTLPQMQRPAVCCARTDR